MADDAGIDFMLPIGRWKGYGGDTDFHGTTLETVTWACGLLGGDQADHRVRHRARAAVPSDIAAKEFVTADHIGEGRFGLNIVAGWNEGEFEMFGVEQRDHETRYEFAQEWIDVVKRAWTEPDEFDFDGRFFKLKGVRAKPKPFGGTRPLIMNAGSSGTGQAFALRNCDAFFTATGDIARRRSSDRAAGPKKLIERASEARSGRGRLGRDIEVYTIGQVVCRPTQKEAEEYLPLRQHRECGLGRGRADAGAARYHAAEHAAGRVRRQAQVASPPTRHRRLSRIVGTPDQVAERACQPQPGGRARHRGVVRQLSRRRCRFSATRCCRGWSAWACARIDFRSTPVAPADTRPRLTAKERFEIASLLPRERTEQISTRMIVHRAREK